MLGTVIWNLLAVPWLLRHRVGGAELLIPVILVIAFFLAIRTYRRVAANPD